MAPFPESEDMTIKRLTVALRKNDYQLLKMGTYKLHEKFHTGYDFEMTEELANILETVETKQYPPEISDILCSTIRDILSKKGISVQKAPDDMQKLAQMINSTEVSNSTGFEEIKSPKTGIQNTPPVQNTPAQNTARQAVPQYQNQYQGTVKEVSSQTPVQTQLQAPSQAPVQMSLQSNLQTPPAGQSSIKTPPQAPLQPRLQEPAQAPMQTPPAGQPLNTENKVQDNAIKDVAVFYDDFNNDIDFSNVKDYKNNLNFLFSKSQNAQDYNILKQISSLTQLLDTNVSDIDKIVSMLTTSKGKVSFVTASQSQNISKIFYEKSIDFDIPFVKKPNNKNDAFDFIPMVGSTNIFVCSNCNMRTLKTDFNTRTLSVQCPHCDSAAFPDIYAVNSYNPDCNPVFWHRAFAALVKSKIWILVNPPLDENKEVIVDFIKTAYETGLPAKIYILSKENDKREFYRQMFLSINENCVVKHNFQDQDKLCEAFINDEIIKKVFA